MSAYTDRINQPSWKKQWYALYVVVRHEKKVQSALVRRNVENYLPLKECLQSWKDRRKKILFPLFPGYVFVCMAMSEKAEVLSTAGVVRLLGSGDTPTPVSVDQIDAIKTVIESRVPFEEEIYCAVGKDVLVKRGPLRGVVGRVLEFRGRYRLIVSVDIMRRSVSAEVNLNDVELI